MEQRKLFYHALSKQGSKSPSNEDSYCLPEANDKFQIKSPATAQKGYLFVVADGMGGANAGEVASELASNWLVKNYYENEVGDDILAWYKKAIQAINQKLLDLSQQHAEYEGMGTTLVCVLIKAGQAYVANVGDSRLYMWNFQNELQQITKDDSEVWELYEKGYIKKDEIIKNPRKHLLSQALGVEKNVKVHTYKVDLPDKYMFLLCSDGLTDVATDKMLLENILQANSLKESAEKLYDISQANKSKDDVTILLITNLTDSKFASVTKSYGKKQSQTGSVKPAKRFSVGKVVPLVLILIAVYLFWHNVSIDKVSKAKTSLDTTSVKQVVSKDTATKQTDVVLPDSTSVDSLITAKESLNQVDSVKMGNINEEIEKEEVDSLAIVDSSKVLEATLEK